MKVVVEIKTSSLQSFPFYPWISDEQIRLKHLLPCTVEAQNNNCVNRVKIDQFTTICSYEFILIYIFSIIPLNSRQSNKIQRNF